MVSRRFDDDSVTVGGRWATSSPRKTTTFPHVTSPPLGVAGNRVPHAALPIAGATNYHVDASDYLQPIELRAAEPSVSAR